jgi:glucose/arabinose dehydrogenase
VEVPLHASIHLLSVSWQGMPGQDVWFSPADQYERQRFPIEHTKGDVCMRRILQIVGFVILASSFWLTSALAFQTSGFQETLVANGLTSPTAMQFAPDGRLFVAEQSGHLRVIKNGTLLPSDFVTLSVTSNSERGLLGIAFHPNFAQNGFLYLYYTRTTSPVKNRVSRFTASTTNPDVAQANSEVVILDNIASDAGNHNGGAIHFGLDGKLYVAVGDGGSNSSNSQSLNTLSGKLLRINADGSIPSDNPFVGTAGARGEIWALGLRNPYTFDVDTATGKIHINDVGQNSWEEINLGAPGANYGWPTCEGLSCGSNPNFTNPIYTYSHAVGRAITGGAFYRQTQFPSQYHGSYFFSDYLGGWIKRLNSNNQVSDFWNPQNGPVDLKVGPDGALYYLSIFNGAVYKIQVTSSNQSPTASFTATPMSGSAPLSVSFNGGASSDPDGDPLTYSWNFGDGTPTGSGVSVNHTYQNSGSYVATLTVNDGEATASASRTISVGTPPVGNIQTPAAGAMYNAGDTISYSGSATDAQDGTLAASRFSWTIVFHHDTHSHPFLGPVNGVTSGSFQIPRQGESSANTFYRIHLTVTDSSGLTHQTTRDILPRKANVTLATNIPGLTLNLDGQPVTAPHTFQGVVGFTRTLGAPSPQTVGGVTYAFVSWSDLGAQTHTVNTPAVATTYTAIYQIQIAPAPGINIDFQPAGAAYPGYLVDSGQIYGDRGNGYTYGWNADKTAASRNRNSSISPDERYDTLIHMENSVWEIAVPNGSYTVHAVVGDPAYADVVSKLTVEGLLAINGTTNTSTPWLEATVTVSVNDGRLTLGNLAGSWNKICYIDISAPASDTTAPVISGVSASGLTSAAATLNWTTNEASDSQVEYGTSPSYGSSTTLNSARVTSHSQTLSGLTPNTTYHFRVKSRDAAGNLAVSGDFVFTTLPSVPSGVIARVNFQPAGAAFPGYLVDSGQAYGARGNGFTYGWNADKTAASRNRNSSTSPDERYDTLIHMEDSVWEIALPNGSYTVHVVVGDPAYADIVSRLTVEGALAINGTTNTSTRWLEATVTVSVTDGRLSVGNLAGSWNKICYIDISTP